MMRLFSLFFLFSLSTFCWAQEPVFQGRIDLGRELASFQEKPPVKGTLYLLTGAAAAIRIVSEEPFSAVIDFVQGEWKGEEDLASYRTNLRFEGAGWAETVLARKPRQGGEDTVYPYRKFQVAALAEGDGFRVIAITALF